VLEDRRGRRLGEVVVTAVDHAPVRHVAQRRQRVTAQQPHLEPRQQVAEHGDGEDEHHQQRRQQSAGAAQPEVGEPDPAALLPFGQQQRGDEEAGEDEERVHPEEAARQPGDAAVEEQYSGDGERAHTVQGRPVGQRSVIPVCRSAHGGFSSGVTVATFSDRSGRRQS
jgi:hypothetical protein